MDWSLPYPSHRAPVLGRSVVATSQPLAASAGLSILERGGSAADAAVATAAALTVVEPTANGLGGDAMAMVWDGVAHGLNGSGRSAERLDAGSFLGRSLPRRGWDSVTVPGAIAAWGDLHARWGRLPWPELLAPAITLAERGFPVSPGVAEAWARAVPELRRFPEWRRTFAPGGRAPAAGELVRLPEHAATLRLLAAEGPDAFYRGALARWIAAAARAGGSALRYSDFADHRSEWVEPLAARAGGVDLLELPPNGQGVAALIAVSILEARGALALDPDGPDALHLALEAMKLAFREVHTEVAEPGAMRVTPAELLAPRRIAALAGQIDAARARDPGHGVPHWQSTVYLCVGDSAGQAVSFIQSNYEGFGSGVVVPGTGIALHNRAAGFVPVAGHPAALAPGVRPFHTIAPAMALRGGRLFAAFGVVGGPMQPQGHLQVLQRLLRGQNPQAALDAPRWRLERGLRVLLEPGPRQDSLQDLRIRGHRLELALSRSVLFGGGQAISALPEGWVGGSDCRRDGQAVAG